MDSIHSWIDQKEVSRLAETLSSSPERMKEWKKMESDGSALSERQGEELDVEDALDTEVEIPQPIPEKSLNQQRSILAGASQMAKSAGLTHSEKKPVILEDMKTEEAEKIIESVDIDKSVSDTAAVFIADSPEKKGTFTMVQELYGSEYDDSGLCIIDRDGDVLYDSFKNLGLTRFTANVMKNSTMMEVRGEEMGSLRIRHSAREVIEFLSVNSTRGVVMVAARLSQGLDVEQRKQLANNLRQILNAE